MTGQEKARRDAGAHEPGADDTGGDCRRLQTICGSHAFLTRRIFRLTRERQLRFQERSRLIPVHSWPTCDNNNREVSESILLKGGTLIDGTGQAPLPGDLLIAAEFVAETGYFEPPRDAVVLDCAGLAVAPGFIDAHSHSDLQVLENRPEKLRQGVTSEVVGNCGFSAYPAPPDRRPLHDFANGIFCGGEDWGWAFASEYLEEAKRRAKAANVFSLAGHGTLRIAQAGNRLGALPASDMAAMARLLEEAFEQGACGFSTGLMYSPGSSAPFEELETLCRIAAKHGRTYATHMRDYSSRLLEAVDEQIELARRTGCRLQISHFQAAGRRSWRLFEAALEKVERAAASLDVAFDCYPYTAGSTVLTQALPAWALEGGLDALLARLADPVVRPRLAAETDAGLPLDWDEFTISAVGSQANQDLVGMSIVAIARQRGKPPVETALDLLSEERAAVNVIEFCQSEANLRLAISHPLSIVISDGFYVRGRPHPRLYGTFPFLLGEICRNRGWLTLAEAVRKITDAPARRFGIERRGRLQRGWLADITVFDAAGVHSPATYEHPDVPPAGIRYVFRNGRLIFRS
jgi:dihydroorotase/N-acyl-D-amino-acid deacylase